MQAYACACVGMYTRVFARLHESVGQTFSTDIFELLQLAHGRIVLISVYLFLFYSDESMHVNHYKLVVGNER